MKDGAGRIISVGGGKGGVGKSLVAANLAVAFAQSGRSVVLVDADLGAPNLHTLLGIDRLPRTLDSLFDHRISSLSEARLPTRIPNLHLIAGSPAHPGAANLAHTQKLKLLRHVSALDAQVVVVDVGAGTSFNALDIFNVADLRVVVTAPQLTSVQNAYAFLKGSIHRLLRQLAQTPEQLELLGGDGQDQDTARLRGMLLRIQRLNPGFGKAVDVLLDSMGFYLMGNQVAEAQERTVVHSVARMVSDFLSVEAPVLGVLPMSRKIHDSVNDRTPWLLHPVNDQSMMTVHGAAQTLLNANVAALRRSRLEAEAMAEALVSTKPSGKLPAELYQFQRRHPRVKVELAAILTSATGRLEAQCLELSRCGALLSTANPLEVGSRWSLTFTSLQGAPAVELLVRNVRSGKALNGVEFSIDAPLPPSLDACIAQALEAEAPTLSEPPHRP